MAKLLSTYFPENLKNSLLAIGRLDPAGRLILDDVGGEGGLRSAKEVEGVHFQPLNLGWVGQFYVVSCDGAHILEPKAKAETLLRQLEKEKLEKEKAEKAQTEKLLKEQEAALATLEPTMPVQAGEYLEAA